MRPGHLTLAVTLGADKGTQAPPLVEMVGA